MDIEDVKVAVVGHISAGKSTLIGTLIRGENDDGRGTNRKIVMNFPHEKETGMTSSVGYQILGFRNDGSCIHVENKNRKDTWPKIMRECTKLVSFVDLAGHEQYLKTTIFGMSSNRPDYTLIIVEGRGVKKMTKEHMMLALSFEIPFIVVITKIDLYEPNLVNATVSHVGKLIKSARKETWLVRDERDLDVPLQHPDGQFVPVFLTSNVSGEGLDYFKKFLHRLPTRIDYTKFIDDPFEMSVLEGFTVQGIGTVAHGFLTRGTAKVNDVVWIGPDSIGEYHKSKIRTIHYKRMNVDFALPGHHVCVSLPGIERKLLKQGVYILHEKVPVRRSVRKFTAIVKVLSTHPITIKHGYCPILNIDNIRMSARVVSLHTINENGQEENAEYIRGGDRSKIQFKFTYRPAYLREDATFVFREGKTRGFGKVISIDMEQAKGGVKKSTNKKN